MICASKICIKFSKVSMKIIYTAFKTKIKLIDQWQSTQTQDFLKFWFYYQSFLLFGQTKLKIYIFDSDLYLFIRNL